MKKFSLVLNIITIYFVGVFINVPVIAVDDYPYPNSSHCHKETANGDVIGCEADDWYFFKRQCTSYAAWKADNILGNFTNTMLGPNGQTQRFGHANNWDNAAGAIGYSVGTIPAVGAVAVWESNSGDAGDLGHVAIVDSVNANNTINISEYNWNASAANFWMGDGSYNQRIVPSNKLPNEYIYFNESSFCGGENVLIENQNIMNSLSCPALNSIVIKPTTNIQPLNNTVRFYIQ